jgi:hypothetical protein
MNVNGDCPWALSSGGRGRARMLRGEEDEHMQGLLCNKVNVFSCFTGNNVK